jgi:hypothetical protein
MVIVEPSEEVCGLCGRRKTYHLVDREVNEGGVLIVEHTDIDLCVSCDRGAVAQLRSTHS